MRNFKKYIIATSAFATMLVGCTDEQVLDLDPIASLSETTAFSTPALIANTINGMYNAAQIGYYNGNGARGYMWGAAYIEQNDFRGEDVVNTASFFQYTYQSTWDPTNTLNNIYYWVDGYRLINRCNIVINGVTQAVANGVISQAIGDDYIGQAKFLRAITHFELLMHYARPYSDNPTSNLGVPYRTIAIDNQNAVDASYTDGRLSVAECYDLVLTDLDDAEAKISQSTDLSLASKNAAIAFKSRVKLHKRDWAGVLDESAKLTSYQLTNSPSGVFENNAVNSESIFSIRNTAQLNPGTNGAIGAVYKGRTLGAISPILWNDTDWLSDDKRRKTTTSTTEGGDYMTFNNQNGYFSNKYRDATTFSDYAPIIRYAEILLNEAEAEARTNGVTQLAVDKLNKVRNRSLANPSTQQYEVADFANDAELVAKIIKERRIEFLAEGKRWADIHRLQQDDLTPVDGIPAKVANGYPLRSSYGIGQNVTLSESQISYSSYRFVWPLPTLEVQYNPTLKAQQNPNY